MKRKKRGAPLPPTKLAGGRGHRSHVNGRRLMSGPNKSHISDLLHDDAKQIMKRIRARGDT